MAKAYFTTQMSQQYCFNRNSVIKAVLCLERTTSRLCFNFNAKEHWTNSLYYITTKRDRFHSNRVSATHKRLLWHKAVQLNGDTAEGYSMHRIFLQPLNCRMFWFDRNVLPTPYTLPAKNMEYFSFQRIFVFCGVCKVFIYLNYIPTHIYYFWGVNSHSIAKWTANVQK